MNKKIFISYRHAEPDSTLAKRFKDAFEANGDEIFIDFKIKYGDKWAQAVDNALRSCEVLLLLVSDESAKSEPVIAEVRIAKLLSKKHKGKPWILPVRIGIPFDEPLPYEMNIAVGGLHQAYWDGQSSPTELIQKIITSLSQEELYGTVPDIFTIPQKTPKEYKLGTPVPSADPSFIANLNIPGGAVRIDSSFYISRETDDEVLSTIQQERALITIRAARQIGKTSLLIRAAHKGNQLGMKVAFIDFLSISSKCFANANQLWKAVARHVERDLQLPKFVKDYWDDEDDTHFLLNDFAEVAKIGCSEFPTLICMDEIDRIFCTESADEFSAILRAIHSKAAQKNSLWKNVRWVLAGSTEPAFFIKNLHQSPFNIGLRVELRDFMEFEVFMLAEKYQCKANDEALSLIYMLLHGHPYLTQLALYSDVTGKMKLSQTINKAITEESLFREHLHRFHLHLLSDRELGEVMYKIINGHSVSDLKILDCLHGAGLIRPERDKFVARCKLYEDYFSKNLKRFHK